MSFLSADRDLTRNSYYAATVARPQPYASLAGDIECDVAVVVKREIHDAFMNGPEHLIEFFHGYTYSAHPLACAAGIATLETYADEDLLTRAAKVGPTFEEAVHSLKGLLVRTTGDTVALSPPLIVESQHIDQIVGTLADAIKRAA